MTTEITAQQKKATLIVIGGSVQKDAMFHWADLFEHFKVLIEDPITLHVTLDGSKTLAETIQAVKTKLEETKQYRIVAIFHPYIAEGAWRDPKIKVVSTGKKWCMLGAMLSHYNFVS